MLKRVVFAFVLVAVAVGGAAVVWATLGDTQSATGAVNVTTVSSDLYICEPNGTPGPACGSDDSADDEIIFETLEDMRPGDIVTWDLRLRNVGTVDWRVSGVTLISVEDVDPGNDCPSDALRQTARGITILGKNGDEVNDNAGVGVGDREPIFRGETTNQQRHIDVAAGDYEDVRLRLGLDVVGTQNCDGNQWSFSWQFEVN